MIAASETISPSGGSSSVTNANPNDVSARSFVTLKSESSPASRSTTESATRPSPTHTVPRQRAAGRAIRTTHRVAGRSTAAANATSQALETSGRTPAPAGGSVRGQLRPPGAERLEGVPEPRLRALLVERLVDVRRHQGVDRRGERQDLRRARVDRAREREVELVHEFDG